MKIATPTHGRILVVSLLLLLSASVANAAGTLYGLFFEHATTSEGLFTVDPATAAQAPLGAGIAGCCLVAAGVSSLDPAADVLYFVGFFQADPPGQFRLFSLDLASGSVLANPVLPAGRNYNAIEVDDDSGTLYALTFDTATMSEGLVSLDATTGALTPIGAGIPGCCLVSAGVSTFDSTANRFYFTGFFMADPPGTLRLFGIDAATGAVISNPLLAPGRNFNHIEFDAAEATLYAVTFDQATTSEGLGTLDPVSGALTPLGAGIPGCCLLPIGVGTLDAAADRFYFVGFFQADPPGSPNRLFAFDTTTGNLAGNPVLALGFNHNALELDPDAGPPGPTEVEIDVKPGSATNPINPRSNGVIPVAVLTTKTFDAQTVDVTTVRFSGPAGAPEAHGRGHYSDIDRDGDIDLLLHFRTRLTGISCGDTEATLVGATFGGTPITGTDSIVTVGCH